MENNYKYFETTADIGIEVLATDFTNGLIQSAKGCMNLITDIDQIKPVKTSKIHLESEDEYGLLYDWITELLILLDSENYIARDYNITINKNEKIVLDATITGDEFNRDKYVYKTEVKAITNHLMQIVKENNLIKIRFIVDL
ncbi:MAG: archease [Methanosphaera sp.]|nr:archease [Methanosphaera sp.]